MPPGLQSVDYWGATPNPAYPNVGEIEALA
jgi:hypothetical protein